MSESVLAIGQRAAIRLRLDLPGQIFGSSDETLRDLDSALNEAAAKILHAHDWQRLLTLETHVGDGTQTDFAQPTDFLRMPKEGEIWSTRWQHPLAQISPEDWLHLDVREYDTIVGSWTRYGDDFVYKPALANGESAKFWYVSRNHSTDSKGVAKSSFTADSDIYLLDSRVLELVTVATFRAQKSLDYREEMAAADLALSRAIERDKGARIITQNSRRNMRTKVAYPWTITP